MAEQDFYSILGIPRDASPDQIKSAYRKLAKKYHPDRNPNDKTAETRFKEVQEAYDVLSDPEKRRNYDQFGRAGVGMGGGFRPGEGGFRSGPGGQRVYTWRSGGGPDIPIEDLDDLFSAFAGAGAGRRGGGGAGSIFEEFLGRGRRGQRQAAEPPPNLDLEQPVTLSFDQAVRGTTLDLQLTHPGGGRETLRVKIPAGVSEGQRVRLRGKGNAAGNGVVGDLYVVCHVQPHPYFRREGNDIYLDLPLSVSEAVLGVKVEIPTLEGRTVLTVPPGTASGAKLRLKGKGVQPTGKPPGDQYAVIRIVPPKKPTPRQRELMEQFRADEENVRGNVGW